MVYERIGKTIRKESDPKKISKNQSKIAACEQKPLARKRIFVQTPLSHSTLKLKQKEKTFISRRKTTRFFAPFLFRLDQNYYSNLTSKIMKLCEQIFKKT